MKTTLNYASHEPKWQWKKKAWMTMLLFKTNLEPYVFVAHLISYNLVIDVQPKHMIKINLM